MAVWSVDARLEGGNNSAAHRKEGGRGLYEIPVVHTQSKELIGWGVEALAINSTALENLLSLVRLLRSWVCGSTNGEQLKSLLFLSQLLQCLVCLIGTCPLHPP